MMSPMMISHGEVPVTDVDASFSVWVGRAATYAGEAVTNAERAHQHTIEKRLTRPSRGWTADEVTRSYRGSADGERRYREEADVLTLHGYEGWLETRGLGDPVGARILIAPHLGGPDGYAGPRSSIRRTVTWTRPTTARSRSI
jgi:hypothetical protein